MALDKPRYKRLGEILVEKGLITKEELIKALDEQRKNRKAIGEILVEMGIITWEEITEALSQQYNIPMLKDPPRAIPVDVLRGIPKAMIDELRAIPVDKKDDKIVVVTDSVYNISRITSEIKFLTGKDPVIYLITPIH